MGGYYLQPRDVMRNPALTNSEFRLLSLLFDAWNLARHPTWFPLSKFVLIKLTGLNAKALIRARRGLEQKLLIEVRGGRGRRLVSYHLSDLTTKDVFTTQQVEEFSL